jgi:hypothetical protein
MPNPEKASKEELGASRNETEQLATIELLGYHSDEAELFVVLWL